MSSTLPLLALHYYYPSFNVALHACLSSLPNGCPIFGSFGKGPTPLNPVQEYWFRLQGMTGLASMFKICIHVILHLLIHVIYSRRY